MRDGPFVGRFNATDVEERLAEAGRVLLTLPWSGCFPAGFRCLWPDQVGPSSCAPHADIAGDQRDGRGIPLDLVHR